MNLLERPTEDVPPSTSCALFTDIPADTAAAPTATTLIASALPIVAGGLAGLLARFSHVAVVGCVHTRADAINAIAAQRPRVVIIDHDMLDSRGAAMASLVAAGPSTAVLVLGKDEPVSAIARVLSHGAAGYVTTRQPVEELAAAIAAVAEGGRSIPVDLLDSMLEHLARPSRHDLSDRQLQIVRLLAAGTCTAAIAEVMGLSVGTLRNQVRGILVRLGAHSRLEAVAIARQCGMLGHTTVVAGDDGGAS